MNPLTDRAHSLVLDVQVVVVRETRLDRDLPPRVIFGTADGPCHGIAVQGYPVGPEQITGIASLQHAVAFVPIPGGEIFPGDPRDAFSCNASRSLSR